METFNFKISVPGGLHARNAMILSKKSAEYQSEILILKENTTANAKKVMDIMLLRAARGDDIVVLIEGPDEIAAMEDLKQFFLSNFGNNA